MSQEDDIMRDINEIFEKLNNVNRNQQDNNRKIVNIKTQTAQILQTIQRFQYNIIVKILECCKSPYINPEETKNNMKKIKTDLAKLNEITNQITGNITSETNNINEIQTNTESITRLLSSAEDYIKNINCKDCNDETKIANIILYTNNILQTIIQLRDKIPKQNDIERNEYAKKFLLNLFGANITIPDTALINFNKSNAVTDSSILDLKKFIYLKIVDKLSKDGAIDVNAFNKYIKVVDTMKGGSRYKRKMSFKRPRKRSGLRSKSRRAPKRRTRKYRSHKYRR